MRAVKSSSFDPIIKGITIDDPRARNLDDGLWMHVKPDGGWILKLSIANPSDIIPKGSPADKHARKAVRTEYEMRQNGTLARSSDVIPAHIAENFLSFLPKNEAPAITVEMHFDKDGTLQKELCKVYESVFSNTQKLNTDDFLTRLKTKPYREWAKLLHAVMKKKHVSLETHFNSVCGLKHKGSGYYFDHRKIQRDGRQLITLSKEIARELLTELFEQNEIPFLATESDVFNIKFPGIMDQQERQMLRKVLGLSKKPYVPFTTPLRRYACIVNLRQLTAFLRDEPLPYSRAAIEKIKPEIEKEEQRQDLSQAAGKSRWKTEWIDYRGFQLTHLYYNNVRFFIALCTQNRQWGVGLTKDLAADCLESRLGQSAAANQTQHAPGSVPA